MEKEKGQEEDKEEREEAVEGGVKAKSKRREEEEEDKDGKEKAIPRIQRCYVQWYMHSTFLCFETWGHSY